MWSQNIPCLFANILEMFFTIRMSIANFPVRYVTDGGQGALEVNQGVEVMSYQTLERIDWIASTLAVFGTFGFFIAVIAYGWYQAFLAMAG